jgi:hypothetical protein
MSHVNCRTLDERALRSSRPGEPRKAVVVWSAYARKEAPKLTPPRRESAPSSPGELPPRHAEGSEKEKDGDRGGGGPAPDPRKIEGGRPDRGSKV